MVLHQVLVIAQAIQVQQSVHRNIHQLHEATELHHGGDKAAEGLADALTQPYTFEECGDITIRFIGALLQA